VRAGSLIESREIPELRARGRDYRGCCFRAKVECPHCRHRGRSHSVVRSFVALSCCPVIVDFGFYCFPEYVLVFGSFSYGGDHG